MLSPRVLELLKSVFTTLDSLKALPITWDDSNNSLKVLNSSKRITWIHCFSVHTLFYALFVACNLQCNFNASIMDKYWAGICIIGYPGVFEAFTQCVLKRDEIAQLFIQINALDEMFDGNEMCIL